MADKVTHSLRPLTLPVTITDEMVLKRFLGELTGQLNANPLFSYPLVAGYKGTVPQSYLDSMAIATNSMLEAAVRVDALSGTVKNYITKDVTTQVLQNAEDISVVAQQFGTFYDDATSAAWYGLTVKTGELISGFTVGGLDTDTTTPGTAGSFFAISADKFTVGRALEDIDDPSELAYVQANNLPYGTMYDANTDKVIPAFLIEWNGTSYDIFFNGKTTFSNVTGTLSSAQQSSINTLKLLNGAGWTNDSVAIAAQNTAKAAQTTANTASTNATNALNQLTDIASDNVLTPTEKFVVIANYAVITSEQSGIDTQATNYGITTEKTNYDNAITALTTYLGGLTTPTVWNNTAGNTTIVGTTFRSKFNDVYTTRQTLLNTISANAKTLIDQAASSGGGNNIYYETDSSLITNPGVDDLWLDTNDNYKPYRWSGTAWVSVLADAALDVNNGTTTINGSKLTTGTITALQIAAATITASKIAAGTITANEIAAGTITASNINTSSIQSAVVTAAYINALNIVAGSVAAENISGTTISGKTISGGTVTGTSLVASKFQVAGLTAYNSSYPNNTAPMVIIRSASGTSTTSTTLTFYGASYGSGYRNDRFVGSTTKFLIDLSATTGTWASSTAYVGVAISGTGVVPMTARISNAQKIVAINTYASVSQASSWGVTITFTVSGSITTPTWSFRVTGFNVE